MTLSSLIFSACGNSKAENVNNTNANAAPTTVDVQTAKAVVQNIPTYFEATGNLASDAQTDVAPTVGGKILQVNFDIGSYVQKGAVLVQLDDRDARIRLEQANAQVEQAISQVRQAQANVDQAIANLRQTQARLNVKDGESFDIETFSQVRSINAQLELAEKELQRAIRLLETGDIARTIYDQRKSQRDALLGQLAEARSNAAVAVKAIDTARAQVDTARTVVGNAAGMEVKARQQGGEPAIADAAGTLLLGEQAATARDEGVDGRAVGIDGSQLRIGNAAADVEGRGRHVDDACVTEIGRTRAVEEVGDVAGVSQHERLPARTSQRRQAERTGEGATCPATVAAKADHGLVGIANRATQILECLLHEQPAVKVHASNHAAVIVGIRAGDDDRACLGNTCAYRHRQTSQ